MKKKVVVFGIFDSIHDGHRSFFRQAREYGDQLVVIVGRDSASLRLKEKKTKNPEETRRDLVAKEELVTQAVLGDEEQSSYKVLEELNPDAICLGYDQSNLELDLKKWTEEEQRVIPLYRMELHQE